MKVERYLCNVTPVVITDIVKSVKTWTQCRHLSVKLVSGISESLWTLLKREICDVRNVTANMAECSKSKSSDWVVIGISGVTCGGKTSLANRLKNVLSPVYIFHQDRYFYPDDSPHHIRCKNIDHNNYDILSSLDMQKMHNDILSTMNGDVKAHSASTDTEGKFTLRGKKFLIAEGFTVLNYKPILELCDFRYYFVLDYDECVRRRVFRLYDPPDVPGYFEQCVWPEHIKYRAEIDRDNRIRQLDGRRPDTFEVVMADLKTLDT